MQLINKLMYRNATSSFKTRLNRGLSTAELVGIIVIVGILGAVGGTYISGLITQSGKNAVAQNANTLNTVYASAIAAGATAANGASGAGTIDTTDITHVIHALNTGVVVNGVTYQMAPAIADTSIASYAMSAPPVVFTPVAGATTP